MEIIKNEDLNLEYVDYEEYLDNNDNLDADIKLIINGIINDKINEVLRIMTSLYCCIELLVEAPKNNLKITHDEYVVYKYKIRHYQTKLSIEKDNCEDKEGVWKYIDKDIYDVYNINIKRNRDSKYSLDYLLNYRVEENK